MRPAGGPAARATHSRVTLVTRADPILPIISSHLTCVKVAATVGLRACAAALEDWAADHVAEDADLGAVIAALESTGRENDPRDAQGSERPDIDSVFVRRGEAGSGVKHYARLHSIPAPGDDDTETPHGGLDGPDGASHVWHHQAVGPTFRDLYRYHTGASVVVGNHRGAHPDVDAHVADADPEAAVADSSSNDEDDEDSDNDLPPTGRSKRPRT